MERVEAEKWEGVEEREELLGNKRKKEGKERVQGERAGEGNGRKNEEKGQEEGNAQGWHLPALVGSREQTFPQRSLHFLAWKDAIPLLRDPVCLHPVEGRQLGPRKRKRPGLSCGSFFPLSFPPCLSIPPPLGPWISMSEHFPHCLMGAVGGGNKHLKRW